MCRGNHSLSLLPPHHFLSPLTYLPSPIQIKTSHGSGIFPTPRLQTRMATYGSPREQPRRDLQPGRHTLARTATEDSSNMAHRLNESKDKDRADAHTSYGCIKLLYMYKHTDCPTSTNSMLNKCILINTLWCGLCSIDVLTRNYGPICVWRVDSLFVFLICKTASHPLWC